MPRPPDVIVIGAGIVGSAVAYELARRGASVDVLEARRAGMGATQASAGMLAPYVETRTASPFLDLTLRSLSLFDEFIDRVESDSGISIPYRRTGTLQVASDEAGMQALESVARNVEAHEGVATRLDAKTVRAEEPHLAAGAVGGLVIPAHGFVAAGEVARALAVAARRHGAQFVEDSEVRSITPGAGELAVGTDRGSLSASAVVLAAGSWSSQIEIAGVADTLPVHPVRGQLLRLAWKGHGLRRTTWGDRCYLVPWDDGTLLVGATMEDVGFSEETTVAGVRGLLDAVCALLPDAAKAGFVGARAGLRPASADLLPIIGPSPACPNLMYATAHYRSGVLLAPLTGTLVAEAIVGGVIDAGLRPFGPGRFADV